MSKQSLTNRFYDWMRGRYGADELGNVAVGISVALLLVNVFAKTRWLGALALAFALYACWRISSKNIAARRAENHAFLSKIGPLAHWIHNPREAYAEMRAYKHLTCPSCHQKMRVPRGKGKMRVTCPSCKTKFDARS